MIDIAVMRQLSEELSIETKYIFELSKQKNGKKYKKYLAFLIIEDILNIHSLKSSISSLSTNGSRKKNSRLRMRSQKNKLQYDSWGLH